MTGQHLRFYFVDVFAQEPLNGNPLALVINAQDLEQPTMQRIARELNQSETTFLLPPTHIPQFTETKNRIDKRQGQADGEHVDEEVAAPRSGFAIVIPCECGEDQSPQSTERSSAWSDGQSAC